MAGNWSINGFYDSSKLTGLFEAAQRRESCRLFAAAPSTEQWNTLLVASDELAMPGTRIALGLCDNSLFQPMLGLFMKFENVQRFAAIIAHEGDPKNVVNAGISGEMFLLKAVELGLGGCWVSGTFKRGQVGIKLRGGEKLLALIALGTPKKLPNLPIQRKRKDLSAICPEFDTMGSALKEVAQYVQIAPSAMNLQPWRMKLLNTGAASIAINTPALRLDLGIAMCHVLLALGSTPALFTLDDNATSATVELL